MVRLLTNESTIKSPDVEWRTLTAFNLAKISKIFEIADFERTISPRHVTRIMNAIRTNTFYDNIIRVVKRDDGRYDVIDAQHRLSALWRLHKEEGLGTYDLVLQIFDREYARTVFRKLNMGKALTVRDHTKAMDTGKIEFFTELAEYCTHNKNDHKGTYADLLSALSYAKTGSPRAVNTFTIERILEGVTKEDITFMQDFCHAIKQVSPLRKGSSYYRALVYRNIFKIGYENELSWMDMMPLFEKAVVNEKIKWRFDKNNELIIREVYDIIIDEVIPQTDIKLIDEIERKRKEDAI